MSEAKKKRGFAAISPERLREIASAGGIARKKAFDQSRANAKGGAASGGFVRPSAAPGAKAE